MPFGCFWFLSFDVQVEFLELTWKQKSKVWTCQVIGIMVHILVNLSLALSFS